VYQQPVLAKGEQIVAVPTLIKKVPEPLRRFIGTMADAEKILIGLDIQPKEEPVTGSAGRKGRNDGRKD
jgi:circadian clock protein KaiB